MITNMATHIRYDLGIPEAAEAERARRAEWVDGLRGMGFVSVDSSGGVISAYCDQQGMEEATPGRDCIMRNITTVGPMGPAPPPGSVIGPGGNTIVPGYGVPMSTAPKAVQKPLFSDDNAKLFAFAGIAIVALMAIRR